MPRCRNCGREITRFDQDICPHCGAKRPIDPGYETMDMTGFLDRMGGGVEELRPARKERTYRILLFLLGFLGADLFYLGKWEKGLFALLGGLLLAGLLALGLYFVPGIGLWGILIALALLLAAHLVRAFLSLGREVRDRDGEALL